MPQCQAQRGFLALRACHRAAVLTCPVCNRGVCRDHSVEGRCAECADAGADWRTDPQGPARYRRRFVQEDGWVSDDALYWGTTGYGFEGQGQWVDDSSAEGYGIDS